MMQFIFRRKFSARNFTPDCIKYNCVATQYIGELCRYLLNAPANPDDAKLKLNYAFGNGIFQLYFYLNSLTHFSRNETGCLD